MKNLSSSDFDVDGRLKHANGGENAPPNALAGSLKAAACATHDYAKQNPWKVLGISAMAGLVLGVVLGRR